MYYFLCLKPEYFNDWLTDWSIDNNIITSNVDNNSNSVSVTNNYNSNRNI